MQSIYIAKAYQKWLPWFLMKDNSHPIHHCLAALLRETYRPSGYKCCYHNSVQQLIDPQ
jgi:hypothetical protein